MLPPAGKDVGDRSMVFDYDGVGVNERHAKIRGELLPDRGFADGHGSDQCDGTLKAATTAVGVQG
jgi:hypothetical protein